MAWFALISQMPGSSTAFGALHCAARFVISIFVPLLSLLVVFAALGKQLRLLVLGLFLCPVSLK